MEAYWALGEEMTKQQCIQSDLDDGNFAKYAVTSMQYTTDTAPPTGLKMSSKSADHSYSLAAFGNQIHLLSNRFVQTMNCLKNDSFQR